MKDHWSLKLFSRWGPTVSSSQLLRYKNLAGDLPWSPRRSWEKSFTSTYKALIRRRIRWTSASWPTGKKGQKSKIIQRKGWKVI